MTPQLLLTLAVTAGTLVLMLSNRVRVDVAGLIVMTTLILLRLVTPAEGISGFANEAIVTVACMFILSAGLIRTGAIDVLGRWVEQLAAKSETRLLLVTLAIAVPLSAFINNTPVVTMLIPLILGITRKTGISPSRIFMPISFGSQMGGTLTLIGTSTNLLVAGLILELGLPRIELFDITLPALILTGIGVVYLVTAGRFLTPKRVAEPDLLESYELRDYLTVLRVASESSFAGKTLKESRFGDRVGLQVLEIDRAGTRISIPGPTTGIEAGDILLVEGKSGEIAKIAEDEHLELIGAGPEYDFALLERKKENGEGKQKPILAEVIVPPRSPVTGRTLRQLNFRVRHGGVVLGIQRHQIALHERLGTIRLSAGDILLVQAMKEDLQRMHASGELALLGALDLPARRKKKMWLAISIMLIVVLLPALNILPIMTSALAGIVAMFLTGCVKPEEAYADIDWMVLVLLGSMIPLGLAMQKSGAAELIANNLMLLATPLGLYGTFAVFYLLVSLLTNMLSNNAAAVVLTPIAISSALALGVSPMPFVIAVMMAASNSFLTPIGYQTNTFIYGPGGYRFSDFFRLGAPLTVILTVVATFVIPYFFPF